MTPEEPISKKDFYIALKYQANRIKDVEKNLKMIVEILKDITKKLNGRR